MGITTDSLLSKMEWYLEQPVNEFRTSPPCLWCVKESSGMHALDQFAVMMALGDAVSPKGGGGCIPLGFEKHRHSWKEPRPLGTQVVHDKIITFALDSKCPVTAGSQLPPMRSHG